MRHWFTAIALLLLAACSSLKPPIQPQEKLDADTYYNHGLKCESLLQRQAAAKSFSAAQAIYRSLGDAEGTVASNCGLARTVFHAGDADAYANLKQEIGSYIGEVDSSLAYFLVLLNVYEAQQREDYHTISQMAVSKADYPAHAKLQLAAAKLQADAHLGTAYPGAAASLKSMASKYRKQLKKKGANSELYSLALYSLAFHHYSIAEYQQCLDYLKTCIKLDYQYGNLMALGHNLWLQGQAEAAMGNNDAALASLRRAQGIFFEYDNSEALGKIIELIANIKDKP